MASAAALVTATGLPASAPQDSSIAQQPPQTSSLSPESQAEAEARYQNILNAYGSRFSDAQKADLRRMSLEAQPALDRIRAHHLENGDNPALYLKPLVEREKKPSAPVSAGAATSKKT